ncbi:hypothetical protein [Sphingomonas rubra]|uniref:PXPV repeat-containing protein n=1 Tax=Sphingomonas rubra TaxID=634430 RepID=A0A1I5TJ31_9SPHN|nr:hypothetical protein [Sphingomonas rubra]SFP83035.1 hypothetical protein SAMN04488241_10875 [Sphingomonas rubra]
MNRLFKQMGLGVALAVTTVAAAAPADAQRWRGGYRDYHRGGGGRAATGALIGGIVGLGLGAAIASSNNRGRYYDRGYYYDAPPRVVYRDRYYAPPPPPVVVRERVYEPGYYGGGYGYGGGYYDRGYGYGGW